MKILLIQEQTEVREKVVFILESDFDAIVVETPTPAEALHRLNSEAFDLVIQIPKKTAKDGARREIETILSGSGKVPCIFSVKGVSQFPLPRASKPVRLIEQTRFLENLVAAMRGMISSGALKHKAEKINPEDFVRIRTKLLLAVAPLKGDIYIRLSDKKFVKLFREGDVFDESDMRRYTTQKGVQHLFIGKKQSSEFIEKYRLDLERLLTAAPPPTLREVARSNDTAQETVRELTKRLGFTKPIQEIAKAQVQLSMKSMGQSPKLSQVLARLSQMRGKYIPSHSMLVGHIACAIAARMKWGSSATFYKLSLAAFLHDITLSSDELAMIESLQELEKEKIKFVGSELADFREHPSKAAMMARGLTEVPPDVDLIVEQHHERPDGKGFPRSLSRQHIAPLACVFIIAHDLARFMMKPGPNREVSDFVSSHRGKYQSTQFKKIFAAIEVAQG